MPQHAGLTTEDDPEASGSGWLDAAAERLRLKNDPQALLGALDGQRRRAGVEAAVRWRRDLAARWLDTVAKDRWAPRALAVACGHLREAAASKAARSGAFARFVGLDRDNESLHHVRRYHAFPGLRLERSTVKAIARGFPERPGYDFAYALGLYDYLPDGFARMLTASLFERLAPGGVLLVGNFLPTTPNIASMEAFQDWWLRYRTRLEIEELGAEIEPVRIAERSYREDRDGCVSVLTLQRA